MTSDSLSILSLPSGKTVSKTFQADKEPIPYPSANRWDFSSASYDNFSEFCGLLQVLEEVKTACVVRADLIPGTDISKPIVRRKDKHDDGISPTLREHCPGRGWVMLDIDNYPNVLGEPADAEAMRMLTYHIYTDVAPLEFWQVPYFYQWSSSMGLGGWDLAKIHFWVLLEDPITDTVLAQWAAGIDGIDDAPMRTVQPHYIAPPGFIGMADPLGELRSGVVRDFATHDRVKLAYDYVPPRLYNQRNHEVVKLQQALWRDYAGHRWIDVDVASAPMRKIAEIGVGGRLHKPIIASAASWILSCGHSPDQGAWKSLVQAQIALSGHPQSRHRSSDRYLNQVWRSATYKYSPINPQNPPVPRELIINPNQF